MINAWSQRLKDFLSDWVVFVQRFRLLITLLIMSGAIICLYYTMNHLGMNTDTRDMLSPELEWRKLDLEMDKAFPQYTDNILVVIEAGTADEASDAGKLLNERLAQETSLFKSVYYPAGSDFFRTSALLYLDIDELQDLADNLAAIQPFLSRLTEDQSLRGLFNMLNDAIEAKLDGDDIDLGPIMEKINTALIAIENNQHYRLSWQALMGGTDDDKKIYREFIILQPTLDYGGLLPAKNALNKIRLLASELRLTPENNIKVGLTGSAALSHEEVLSVFSGMELSVLVSIILVAIVLIAGLRSGWMVFATLITLLTGLIYTAWFAAITVGELNLISVAFAVLYIGLGVDFAIHFCLRYRESRESGNNNTTALRDTVTNIGTSLVLCAATTAIGFYAFVPTDYDGVAELGLISGTGMFISLIFTLTLLPALISLFPVKFRAVTVNEPVTRKTGRLANLPVRESGKIRIITAILTVVSLVLITKLQFDHNILNLQSPENKSVQTYLELLKDSDTSPWSSLVLADSENEAEKLDEKLSSLPAVHKVVWIRDFIPQNQEEKLGIIEEMDFLLGAPGLNSELPPPEDENRIDTIQIFNQSLISLIESDLADPDARTLHKTLTHFLDKLNSSLADVQHDLLTKLEQSLLANFPGRMETLLQSMNAGLISEKTLPEELRSRWENNNKYRLEIYPRDNLMDNIHMRNFVNEIRAAIPQVTGTPVISIEAGDAVVAAFQQAFFYAFFAIILLLLILTDKKSDTIYIMTPLLLAALLTGAVAVLLDIHLNFANIIALPLLLGIGVDSGIHILHRSRTAAPVNIPILATSAARAVIFSALTTIFSIGNLAFSPHLGTASMGKLLTIGISMTLICTLIVLPSLLAKNNGQKIKSSWNYFMQVNPMENIQAGNKPLDARLAFRLIYPLRSTRITPNHLTCVRLLFGIFAAAGFAAGGYFWSNIGALCFVISNFLDHTDGELARLTGKMSKSGHYFDLISDGIVNIILFVGIGAGLMQSSLGFWALIMGILSGLTVAGIFHMRNEIEKSIGKSDARQPNIGIIEAEDVLYLLPVITLMGWLAPFLTLAAIGAPAFALWTLKEYRELRIKQS